MRTIANDYFAQINYSLSFQGILPNKFHDVLSSHLPAAYHFDIRLSVLILPLCILLRSASSSADWLIPASIRCKWAYSHTRVQNSPSMSLKLLPMLGVPSLPSFLPLSPVWRGLSRRPSSARWLDIGLMGLFAADGGPPELVIDDAVSVVANECTSSDVCRDGGAFLLPLWRTFCSGLLSVRNCVSWAYLLLLGCVLAAEANGKLVSCEPESSIS